MIVNLLDLRKRMVDVVEQVRRLTLITPNP
jgi:hypothetical protein